MKLARFLRALCADRHWAAGAALLLLALALALPRVNVPHGTFTYIVTFDITQSMNTEDVSLAGAPTSRLAFAKTSMREALAQLPCGSKVGWGVFTGQSTLLLLKPVEVCGNYDALLASLDAIDGRMRWTDWSRIAEGGVYSALRVARDVGPGVAVAFITDGQEAPPLVVSNAPSLDIAVPGVNGWLIGVGGDQPAPIPKSGPSGERIGYWSASDVIQVPPSPDSPAGAESHEELSELRGAYLAALAARIGFSYRRLLGPASLAGALQDPHFAHRASAAMDLRWLPALVALVLLTWRYFVLPRLVRPKL